MIAFILGGLLAAGGCLILVAIHRPRAAASTDARTGSLRRALTRAGLEQLPVAAFLAAAVVLGLVGGALAFLLSGIAVLGLLGIAVGALLPWQLVRWRAQQRRRAYRDVWPDAVDHLVASVRSGLGLAEALEQLVVAGPAPLRDEFTVFQRRYHATGSFGHAIDETKDRLADPTADRLLETLRMAREVGGSELVTVLRALGRYLRDEQAIRHEVAARQSWVINAARLGVVAPWLVLLMLSTRPEAAAAYNTAAGALVILSGLAASIVAYRLMIALGRIPEDGRWFE